MSTTTSGITTTTSTDTYGNVYTSAVSTEGLQSEDFVTLMLTELSLQDPTAPVDSASMMNTQLQLSTLEANLATVEAMESLQTSFQQSALSSSSALIGNIVENSETDDEGKLKQYKVSSVEGTDGTILLSAHEITGYYDVYYFDEVDSNSSTINSSSESDTLTLSNSDGDSYEFSTYGKTYEELAQEINEIDGITASVVENNLENYQLVVSVSNGSSSLTQSGLVLSYSKDKATSYSSEAETIAYTSITKIY
jgi:flagellar basal-body rod modification protein FlgD